MLAPAHWPPSNDSLFRLRPAVLFDCSVIFCCPAAPPLFSFFSFKGTRDFGRLLPCGVPPVSNFPAISRTLRFGRCRLPSPFLLLSPSRGSISGVEVTCHPARWTLRTLLSFERTLVFPVLLGFVFFKSRCCTDICGIPAGLSPDLPAARPGILPSLLFTLRATDTVGTGTSARLLPCGRLSSHFLKSPSSPPSPFGKLPLSSRSWRRSLSPLPRSSAL